MAFVEHGPTISICGSVSGCLFGEFVLLYRSSLDILFGQNKLQVLHRQSFVFKLYMFDFHILRRLQ